MFASCDHRPIIILGAARSGTKFLRDTLAASTSTRCTPFDLNYVWRLGNESLPHDAIPAELFNDNLRQQIQTALHRRAGLTGSVHSRRLIEKTVSNTLRVPFVAKVFPDADFVHIVRDGRAVVASSIAQWHAPISLPHLFAKLRTFELRYFRYGAWFVRNRFRSKNVPAIWGVRYPGIDADAASLPTAVVCARQWVASTTSVSLAFANDRTLRYKTVRYEDLVASDSTLRDLIEWLSLPDGKQVLDRYRRTVKTGLDRLPEAAVPADAARLVLHEIEPMLRQLDYL